METLRQRLIQSLINAYNEKYTHLIVDLKGTISCSKIESVEYSSQVNSIYECEGEYSSKNEIHTKLWKDNIKLIAYNPTEYGGDTEGLIELNRIYSEFFMDRLTLFANGDFTTFGLIAVLENLDWITENIKEL